MTEIPLQPEAGPPPCGEDELVRMAGALEAHCRERGPEEAADSRALIEACCRVVCAGLAAPGGGPMELLAPLSETPEPAGLPEARVCRMWIEGANPEQLDWLVAAAASPLWDPVRGLALRALAHYGWRDALAGLLPTDGPQSASQAEGWLEAAATRDPPPGWTDRIASDDWRAICLAETKIAQEPHPAAAEALLLSLTRATPETPGGNPETERVTGRAVAALARLRLAVGLSDAALLDHPAARRIPGWERDYLQALSRWQAGDLAGAETQLRSALASNPWQTAVRLALAALLAVRAPEEALETLAHPRPTWEVRLSAAALLARLGRYDEAAAIVAELDATPLAHEPLRFRWHRAGEQQRAQELALRTALYERQGRWQDADRTWQRACGTRTDLYLARKVFENRIERAPSGGAHTDPLAQRVDAARLAGDALFFRAIASVESAPQRAVADFRAWLRRRAWTDRERDAGGGRIVAAGDALLKLGCPGEAARAYALAGTLSAESRQRLAVALVAAEIETGAPAGALERALNRAAELAADSYWPALLAALGFALLGDAAAAARTLEAGTRQGAPEQTCRSIRALAEAQPIAPADLDALGLSAESRAVAWLAFGDGPLADRFAEFMRQKGDHWTVACPLDSAALAAALLGGYCEQADWPGVLDFALLLERSGEEWAAELATVARLRRALGRASAGELAEAATELADLETRLARQETENGK